MATDRWTTDAARPVSPAGLTDINHRSLTPLVPPQHLPPHRGTVTAQALTSPLMFESGGSGPTWVTGPKAAKRVSMWVSNATVRGSSWGFKILAIYAPEGLPDPR
jgi:hypothetical protein